MDKETIKKLHELEKQRDLLKEHLNCFSTGHHEESVIATPRFTACDGLIYPDGVSSYNKETVLYNHFLPKDLLKQYVSYVEETLELINKKIEEL